MWCQKERSHKISWKLADFGVAKLLNKEAQESYYGAEYEGVPTYMAPEVYDDYEMYSDKSDVWSLGCVMLFYLNSGRHVFYTPEEVQSYHGQESVMDDDAFDKYSGSLLELVFQMISSAEERPTAKEVSKETRLYDRQESGKH